MCNFTIIVPVYNVKKYIEKCVQSVLSQTSTDYEFILVDDGSTDFSCVICNTCKEKHNRMVVLYLENAGASAARNKGLQHVKAYLTFIDLGDWMEVDILHTGR